MAFWRKLFSKEVLSYLFFGVLVTAVNFAVFQAMLFLWGEGTHHQANIVAFIAAATFAYITNKLFVFESRSFARHVLRKEIPSFFGARLLSFAFEEAGLWLLIDRLALHRLPLFGEYGELAVKAVLAVVVVVSNYFFSKFFIFRPKNKEQKP